MSCKTSPLLASARRLRDAVDDLTFAPPVTHVYNPLRYAWRAHEIYLRRCDTHLREIIRILKPQWLIGVGEFALQRAREIVGAPASAGPRLGRILHPSPACPASNNNWPGAVTAQLRQLGVWN